MIACTLQLHISGMKSSGSSFSYLRRERTLHGTWIVDRGCAYALSTMEPEAVSWQTEFRQRRVLLLGYVYSIITLRYGDS